MVIVIKNKLLLYRRFKVDIWGLCKAHMMFLGKRTKNYRSKYIVGSGSLVSKNIPYYMSAVSNNRIKRICLQFLRIREKRIILSHERRYNYVYDLSHAKPFEVIYRLKKYFAEIRLFQYFYLIFRFRHFRRITRKARRKLGLFEHWFMYYLECTLPWFAYRTLFFIDIFESLYSVKAGVVCIN
jgi:hypothetical protein